MKKWLILLLTFSMLLGCMLPVAASSSVYMGSVHEYAVPHAAMMTTWRGVGAGPNGSDLVYSIVNMDYVEFEVYFSDPGLVKGIPFCFELTSSGTCDVEEDGLVTTWEQLADLKKGWNTVRIPLSSYGKGACDRTRFNFLRIYSNQAFNLPEGAVLEYYFRKVAFGTNAGGDQLVLPIGEGDAFNMSLIQAPAIHDVSADAHTIPLFDCSRALGDFTVDTADYKAGGSSLSYTLGNYTDAAGNAISANGQASFLFSFGQFTGRGSVNASQMDTLEFWLYVSDVEALKSISFQDTSFELTSSGTCDHEETSWRLSAILEQCQQNGWNEIRLPFAQSNTNGNTDWTRLNYLRFYFVNAQNMPAKPIVIKIDNIRLTDYVAQESAAYLPLVQALSDKIKECKADIPVWDEENAEVVAQYEQNGAAWRESYQELMAEFEELGLVAQALAYEMDVKKELSNLNRWLEKYETYQSGDENTEVTPPENETEEEGHKPSEDDSTEEPLPVDQNAENKKLLVIIMTIAVITMLADVVVYAQLRKKDQKTAE